MLRKAHTYLRNLHLKAVALFRHVSPPGIKCLTKCLNSNQGSN